MVVERQRSHTSPFTYATNHIEQADEFMHLGMVLELSLTLAGAIEKPLQSSQGAMIAFQMRCQQLHLHDPSNKCNLFDILVKPNLRHGCEIWAIVSNSTDLEKLERTQQGFLKKSLGVQTQTTTLHVLAKFEKNQGNTWTA